MKILSMRFVIIPRLCLLLACQSNAKIESSLNANFADAHSSAINGSGNAGIRLRSAPYVGCWNGMRGGRLRITSNTIVDLGSKEQSSYEEIPTVEKQIEGLETGERYLLHARADFPKSFLARYILLSYNSDETVGVATYDSYEDYLKDHFVGAGLFGKVPCS